MKKLLACLLMVAMVVTLGSTTGCGKKDTPPAKPATDDAYTLDLPAAAKIKQGESKDLTVAIKRGKKHEEDVTVKFDPPKGLTCDPASATIKKGSNDTKVTVKAADDAEAKEYAIKATASPKDLAGEFKVTVEKK